MYRRRVTAGLSNTSPASIETTACWSWKSLRGAENSRFITGEVKRWMNHEKCLSPRRKRFSIAFCSARSRAGSRSAPSTTSLACSALSMARNTPDENTGSMKA